MIADPQIMLGFASVVGAVLFSAAGFGAARAMGASDDPIDGEGLDFDSSRLVAENQRLKAQLEAGAHRVALAERGGNVAAGVSSGLAEPTPVEAGAPAHVRQTQTQTLVPGSVPPRPDADFSVNSLLQRLVSDCGCDAAVLVDADGFILSEHGSGDRAALGAFGAVTFSTLPLASSLLILQGPHSVVVQGERRQLHVRKIPGGRGLLLCGLGRAPDLSGFEDAALARSVADFIGPSVETAANFGA